MEDKTLRRIQSALSRAERGSTQAERDLAMDVAMRMMAEYGITAAQAQARGTGKAETIVKRAFPLDGLTYAQDRADLLNSLAKTLRCKSVTIKSRPNKAARYVLNDVTILGYESDVERTTMLYRTLVVQALNGVQGQRPRSRPDRYGRMVAPAASEVAAFRRAWLRGFTVAVTERLREIEERVRAEAEVVSTGTDVILIGRGQRVEAAFKEAFTDAKKVKPVRRQSSGQASGYTAGMLADLGQNTLNGNAAR